ncbi:MAG: tRNA-specific 2-thiouridylase [Syntrophaceae bacterium]
MIAVALSGGVDSAAAAILLHDRGEHLLGISMRLGDGLPDDVHLKRAEELCAKLKIAYHVIDLSQAFDSIRSYFCEAYRASLTPNPCAVCNRDMKFGLLFEQALSLGADTLATGHYVRREMHEDRCFLSRAVWKNSQEYFLGLLPQEVLRHTTFPLGDVTRPAAADLVRRLGFDIPSQPSSQDVCFIQDDYVSFIREFSGYRPTPGRILDMHGRTVGSHRGALHYTIGQRKGLGMGFGRRVYVLDVNGAANTVTIGDRSEWPHQGFFIDSVNYMKIAALETSSRVTVKVRYKQDPVNATIRPTADGLWVDYPDLFAPGQLAVAYDQGGAILLAGFIRALRPQGNADEHPAWSLMRQDDNGHRFLVSIHATKAKAQQALAALEGRHHKQMYWIEPA